MVSLTSLTPAYGQDIEPPALGPFTGFSTETQFENPDRIHFGFNWGGMNARMNSLMGFNYLHVNDPFLDEPLGNNLLAMDGGGLQLLSAIKGITVDKGGEQMSLVDAEAMEWQPWLDWDNTTGGDSAILMANDQTGGVFGFRTRNFGQRVQGADGRYRLHSDLPPFVGPLEVLVIMQRN